MEIVVAADSDGRGLLLLNLFTRLFDYLSTLKTSFILPLSTQDNNTSCTIKSLVSSISSSSVYISNMPPASTEEIYKKVRKVCEPLLPNDEILKEVCGRLNKQINKGLSKEHNPTASVKCFPTYVRDLPNGHEKGRFLALDLGGTNFRVLLVSLEKSNFHMESKIFAIPQDVMVGPGTGLFDHIASCLASFIIQQDLNDELLPLGFTFSFPCKQEGLTKARLAVWTKGFKCPGVEGNDVVEMLQDAIARRGDVRIKICAVLNDTTGTLMSCAWKCQNCRIGLIVGTGTNACYMEKLENVELWDGELDEPQQVIINTEWGAFGDDGSLDIIRTEYDENIDIKSINPGKQLYEKMISGMYMGELVRLVLVRLVNEGLLFIGQNSDLLQEKGVFFTKYVSEIESDIPGQFKNCRVVLEDLGFEDTSDEDCANVRFVCECISRRAAHLTSAGIAVLLNRIKEKNVTVAVDGSVYRFHPHFHDVMTQKISELIIPGIKFDLMLSEDGSGRGAALVAAVAARKALNR